jgi:isoleucyl-tRNA synthetase
MTVREFKGGTVRSPRRPSVCQWGFTPWYSQCHIGLTEGHALNKVLKDIILRYHIMQRRKVSYIPGWDCHGLPIELKALKTDKAQLLSPMEIRNIARKFAQTTMEHQMNSFRMWGIMGDWKNRYCTMGACSC